LTSELYKVAPPAFIEEESLEAGLANVKSRKPIKPLSLMQTIFPWLIRKEAKVLSECGQAKISAELDVANLIK
jgi:hypothetical protein